MLGELQELAQEHCRDDGGDEDAAEDGSSPPMTWVSTLAALEEAREALDELSAIVEPAAAVAAAEQSIDAMSTPDATRCA